MRVSKQVMAENNAKIVEQAAYLFRENGIEATSVADVMQAAGLTHGGFYRHFASKDELAAVAINKAFDEITTNLQNDIDRQGARQAVVDYVRSYLSEQHVRLPGKGCPIVALGAEVNRESRLQRQAITQGSERLVSLLVLGIEGASNEIHTKAEGVLAVLVGTLILARCAESQLKMNDILSSGHRLAELYISK